MDTVLRAEIIDIPNAVCINVPHNFDLFILLTGSWMYLQVWHFLISVYAARSLPFFAVLLDLNKQNIVSVNCVLMPFEKNNFKHRITLYALISKLCHSSLRLNKNKTKKHSTTS